LDHAVFTDAEHGGARSRYGDTLEQLGYGAENGTWRNFFLSGPTELRDGNFGTPAVTAAPAVTTQLSLEQLFDSLAIAVDSPAAWDLALSLDVTFSDIGTSYRLTLRNGVLVYVERPAGGPADATLTLAKGRMLGSLGATPLSPASISPGTRTSVRHYWAYSTRATPRSTS
jgi:linear primary-alkylsulfatase